MGVRACPGEPYHDEFFYKSFNSYSSSWNSYFDEASMNKVYTIPDMRYTQRHRVLFNLYAFDALRSNKVHSPTLEMKDCDFEYFFDKQALV